MNETVFDRDKRIRNAVLTMPQTFYLCTLNQFVGNNADAWPRQETIASAMNASTRGVQKWQAELEAAGIIQVEVGKGRSLTNHYRLNLDALQPKQDENDEPRSPFREPTGEQMTKTVRPNDEHSAREMTNTVRTERTVERTKKQHSGNSPNSPASSGRKSKAKSDAKLIAFCVEWNNWHSAGIVRQKIRDTNSPGKTIVDAWNRSQRDPEQRRRLDDLPGLRAAIQSSQALLKPAAWFDAAGLIGGKNSNRRWYAEQLTAGTYRDKAPIPALGNVEALQAWHKIQQAAHDHPSDPAGFELVIGCKLAGILRVLRLTRRAIDEANNFEKREQEREFIRAFIRQEAAE